MLTLSSFNIQNFKILFSVVGGFQHLFKVWTHMTLE